MYYFCIFSANKKRLEYRYTTYSLDLVLYLLCEMLNGSEGSFYNPFIPVHQAFCVTLCVIIAQVSIECYQSHHWLVWLYRYKRLTSWKRLRVPNKSAPV